MLMEEEHIFDPHEAALVRKQSVSSTAPHRPARKNLVSTLLFRVSRLTPAATMENTPLMALDAMYDGRVCDAAFQMPVPSAMVWKTKRIGSRPK